MFFFAVDVKAFWWLASARRQLSRVVGRRELRQERFGGSLRREGSFRESWVREKLVAVFRWVDSARRCIEGFTRWWWRAISQSVLAALFLREGSSRGSCVGGSFWNAAATWGLALAIHRRNGSVLATTPGPMPQHKHAGGSLRRERASR